MIIFIILLVVVSVVAFLIYITRDGSDYNASYKSEVKEPDFKPLNLNKSTSQSTNKPKSKIYTEKTTESKNGVTVTAELRTTSPSLKQNRQPSGNASNNLPDDFSKRLMLSYAPKFKYQAKNEFQSFWNYRYNVDPQQLLNSLESNGLIAKGDVSDTIKLLKVDQLKSILKKHSLKQTGRKQELIDRIIENIPTKSIEKYCKCANYVLTPKGENILQEELTQNIIFAHRHPNDHINPYTMSGASVNDTLWRKLHQDCLTFASNNDWGLYRNAKLRMAEIREDEKGYKDALALYAEVCYYDCTGLQNSIDGKLNQYDEDMSQLIVPSIFNRMADIMKQQNISIDDLRLICQLRIKNGMSPVDIDINKVINFIIQKVNEMLL